MVTRQGQIAFAGAVMSQEKLDKTPNDKILTPKPRSNIEYWRKEHEAHKKDLKKKEVRTIIIGDSIIKHVNKSSISKKAEWKSAGIANFGIGGDRVENILYRIQSYPIVKEIRKVVIAVGTNNLFTNSAKMIESTIAAVHAMAKEKFPAADIYIQAILPRILVEEKISQKISKINKGLCDRFGVYFADLTREFTTRRGRIRRNLFRPDGVHLSRQGNDKLATRLLRLSVDKTKTNNR